jgi:hypothetical protein
MKISSYTVKKCLTIAALGFTLFSSGAFLTSHASELTLSSENDDSTIKIVRSLDRSSTTYSVNGQQFTWADLNADQKERLRLVEKKVEIVEQRLNSKSRKLEELANQLERKSVKLEHAAEKIEKTLANIDPTVMTLESLEKFSASLQSVSAIQELEIMEQSFEIEKISSLIEEAGVGLEGEMDKHFLALEKTLITIAEELK